MRIFVNKWFQRFASKEGVTDDFLIETVKRAERGQIDADLGGGVIKQRISRPGAGKSGGFRTIILYLAGDRAFFVYGYAKSERENVTKDELKGFRELAKRMLNYDDAQLQAALKQEALKELDWNE